MSTQMIHIAIVDDHTLLRSGVASLMAEFSDIRVVFQAEDGTDMISKMALLDAVEVVLLDINMPRMDGYETARWLKRQFPKIKVIALSMYEDEQSIIGMIRAGAAGYVIKESTPLELVTAVRTVSQKGFYINELVSGRLLHTLHREQPDTLEPKVELTAKEREFLKWCATEMTYKEVAGEMGISPRTVDSYREVLFAKLGLKSRIGLALFAVKNGIAVL